MGGVRVDVADAGPEHARPGGARDPRRSAQERFLYRIHAALGPEIEDSGRAYALAKLGVHRFTWHEAVQLGPVGARIVSVSPGIIGTPQGTQEAQAHPIMNHLVDQTPLRRMGNAEDVARVVAFALSDQAGFLNGIDLLVDGGCYTAVRVQSGR